MAGIYIHIPFCKAKCRYCDFTSYPSKTAFVDAYMACLYKEMKLRAKELESKTFNTIYFGGGTPSFIDEKFIAGCMNQIKRLYKLDSDAEVTIEINPGTITPEKVEVYKKASCSDRAIKVILYFTEEEHNKVLRVLNELEIQDCSDIVLIDATPDKPSASNVG